jgi:hypothetical protein
MRSGLASSGNCRSKPATILPRVLVNVEPYVDAFAGTNIQSVSIPADQDHDIPNPDYLTADEQAEFGVSVSRLGVRFPGSTHQNA